MATEIEGARAQQSTVLALTKMYSLKKGHFHRRYVNQRPQRNLVPGEEYAQQEKQLPDVALMAIPFRLLDRFPSAFYFLVYEVYKAKVL
ncbi:hypothetical protein AVEN_70067-1 [Araneus ventricosus]|uniref:Uncharacterized protein n=1 Tax=Araneus ventricosus TaxID=182803 RepID=A0A4Y2VDI6_ARAVE|nr:hypothetical protein AVEN_8023-1 [Araneus ventricosus]GBO23351.1 hypothetical protein AVEN_200141-1 [Araneus ventricosus]GBO23353.1 hypothetical protein AVEN_204452-1 [Araneus ventricosus]GBO23356.1 hypothetical protein AVEN_70067-1 [Araneus ventricosus]